MLADTEGIREFVFLIGRENLGTTTSEMSNKFITNLGL